MSRLNSKSIAEFNKAVFVQGTNKIESKPALEWLDSKTLEELNVIKSTKQMQARRCAHNAIRTGSKLYSQSSDRLFKENSLILTYLRLVSEQDVEINKSIP